MGSSLIDIPEDKPWKLTVLSTEQNRERYEALKTRVKAIYPKGNFDLAGQLEKQIDGLLTKAEKEVKTLESKAETGE